MSIETFSNIQHQYFDIFENTNRETQDVKKNSKLWS